MKKFDRGCDECGEESAILCPLCVQERARSLKNAERRRREKDPMLDVAFPAYTVIGVAETATHHEVEVAIVKGDPIGVVVRNLLAAMEERKK